MSQSRTARLSTMTKLYVYSSKPHVAPVLINGAYMDNDTGTVKSTLDFQIKLKVNFTSTYKIKILQISKRKVLLTVKK